MKNWSLFYASLRIFVKTAHSLFYRQVVVTNTENIPDSGPVIFAINHQNAMMDALAIICSTKRQIVFLARADIFQKPFQARLLRKLKILPVYRIRDGADALKQNDEIFELCDEILRNKNSLALFPETTHTDKRRLQALKKGVPRIAFRAEEKSGFILGIKIIPVGIYYSNYQNYYSTILINYGPPVEIAEYMEDYRINPQRAMIMLKDKMTDCLRPLMIDIKNTLWYGLFEKIRELYDYSMLKPAGEKMCVENKFVADKKVLEALENYAIDHSRELQELDKNVNTYYSYLENNNFRDWLFDNFQNIRLKIISDCIVNIAILPFILYGIVTNYLPFRITEMAVRKISDKQFHSSVKFGLGLILFPFYYLVLLIILSFITGNVLLMLILIICMPVCGKLMFSGFVSFNKLFSKIRFRRLFCGKDPQLIEMINLRKWIISRVDEIVIRNKKQYS
jgi:1-acyl-sn-glycerol-3-phosphate acyltransferase